MRGLDPFRQIRLEKLVWKEKVSAKIVEKIIFWRGKSVFNMLSQRNSGSYSKNVQFDIFDGLPARGGMGAKCGFAGSKGRTTGGVKRPHRAPTRLMTPKGSADNL